PKSLDINQVIAQSLNELSTLIDEKNAEFTYQEMPIIEGEESLLSNVFYQLIHNALHYQPPGNQPKIHIGVEELEKEWRFCITDNGIGITANLSDKIFKMFRRGVSHKHYEGAGTGLTFAKRIINKYHGDIWFESIKGQGSSFYFTLSKC
ncbi:MAG: ATP-binding protein, partial [Nonlabens ulvanivorans]|uniref:sensor histidine kinase n=1 Tax=Nonlabens ulvanivorans TaxID=906888 RepID=UPI003267F9EA